MKQHRNNETDDPILTAELGDLETHEDVRGGADKLPPPTTPISAPPPPKK